MEIIRPFGNLPELKRGDYNDDFQPYETRFGWVYDRIAMTVIMTNAKFYKFDILGFQQPLHIAKYVTGEFFGRHIDSSKGKHSNRKLSLTIQLSDSSEYEGGEVQFLKAKECVNAPKTRGTAIIFPSYLYHRGQPVISGCRMSLVAHIAGPPYR